MAWQAAGRVYSQLVGRMSSSCSFDELCMSLAGLMAFSVALVWEIGEFARDV